MKHILNFNDYLNESKNYQGNLGGLLSDALAAFNSKYGTKLSMKNFDTDDREPSDNLDGVSYGVGQNQWFSNNSAKKDINKLKSSPEWSSSIGDYERLGMIIDKKDHKITFFKAKKYETWQDYYKSKDDDQILFIFP